MTLFVARRAPGEPGPIPAVGAELWLEDLASGPLAAVAATVRGARVRVELPEGDDRRVAVPVGQRVTVTYTAEATPCEAQAVVVAADGRDTPGCWLLIESVHRMQRRAAIRVPVQLITRVIADDAEPGARPEVLESGITEDLSANGVLVRLASPVDSGAQLRLLLHCGGAGGDVDVTARVVRVDHDPTSARPYRAALSFPDLDAPSEARLVRFLFDRQRQLRQRESGMG